MLLIHRSSVKCRLNVAQCRSAKNPAAPRGLRRSTRNSSSSCSVQQQQQEFSELIKDSSPASLQCLAFLPVFTSSLSHKAQKHKASDNQKRKVRQERKRQPSRQSSLKLEALEKRETSRQRPFKSEALDDIYPTRQKSFKRGEAVVNSELAKQKPLKLDSFVEVAINRQKSFKPEALAELRVLRRTSSCTTIGRKRVVGVDDLSEELAFPDFSSPTSSSSSFSEIEYSLRKRFASPRTPSSCLDKSPSVSLTLSELESPLSRNFPVLRTPSTPASRLTKSPGPADDVECGGDSLLEELPFDLLLRIVCCLQHDDLRPVSYVCKRLMKAVSISRQCHFSFTTPHREKKGKRAQLFLCNEEQSSTHGGLDGTFVRPPTPNAPRQPSRPAESKFSHFEACPFAPPLFQQDPPSLLVHSRKSPKPLGFASHRVLFNEDELCQAVAQNTL